MANRFINQAFGQAVGLGQQTVQQMKQQISQEELRVGAHTVITKEQIAEGGFGVVWLVTDLHTRKDLVLKRCNVERPEIFEIVRREINVLQRFASPLLVELVDSDTVDKNRSREALILLEYYPGGHLMSRLQKRQGVALPLESICRIFGQLCEALLPLHESSPPVIHRDLKLENVLFGNDGKVRLCDFGSCLEAPIYTRNSEERQRAEESISKETTQMYRAPEMVDLYMRPSLTEKTDIWAMGCMLYALCYLAHPFPDGSSLSILGGKVNFPSAATTAAAGATDGATAGSGSSIPADFNTLIMRMLDIDPEARPDLRSILNSVTALAAGKPLPAYQLSAEAQHQRKERLARNEVRDSRMKTREKKKAPAPNLPKTAVKINPSSAAAKRLAAKRGQPVAAGAAAGDYESSSEQSGGVASHNAGDSSKDAASFAAFGDDGMSTAATAAADGGDAFTAFDDFPSSASGKIAVFVDTTADNEFDPFSPSGATAGSDFSSGRPESGTFSAFDAASETSGSERASASASRPQSGAFSPAVAFDAFDIDSYSSSKAGVASAFTPFQSDGFDTVAATPSGATFDPFADEHSGVESSEFTATARATKPSSVASILFASVHEESSSSSRSPAAPVVTGRSQPMPPPLPPTAAPSASQSRTPPPKPPKRPSGLVPNSSSGNVNANVSLGNSQHLPLSNTNFDPFGDDSNNLIPLQYVAASPYARNNATAVDTDDLFFQGAHSTKSAPATPQSANSGDVDLLGEDLLSMELPSVVGRSQSDSTGRNSANTVLDLFDQPAGQSMQHGFLLQPTHAAAGIQQQQQYMNARTGMQQRINTASYSSAMGASSPAIGMHSHQHQPQWQHHHHQHQQQNQHKQQYTNQSAGYIAHNSNGDPFASLNQFGQKR